MEGLVEESATRHRAFCRALSILNHMYAYQEKALRSIYRITILYKDPLIHVYYYMYII